MEACASGNLKLYAVNAENAIANASGINSNAKITTCWGLAFSFILCINGFFIIELPFDLYQLQRVELSGYPCEIDSSF